ncbi:MAG: GIY-YIG nuclease family protein [Bacteroidia bacterium]
MKYFVYVLRSEKDGSFYIGHTNNLDDRIIRHNSGRSLSTKAKKPWELMYKEEFESRGEAR